MLNIKTLSILAIAGTAIALPQGWTNFGGSNNDVQGDDDNRGPGGWVAQYFGQGQNNAGDNGNVAYVTEVATAYTTVTYDGKWGGHFGGQAAPTAAPAAPAPEAPAASSPAPASGSNDGSYMSIVNEWRGKLGLSSLTEDGTLQANALKTVQDGNGQMVHELNPGSFAQVLAPGDASDFEKVFVGGWLCERPSLSGLDGICSSMSQGWAYNGETGHADILVSKAYSKIGCALAAGIWGCDLA